MLYSEATTLARELMTQHGLLQESWRFAFHNRRRSLGTCEHPTMFRTGRILLSRHAVRLNGVEVVRDTVLHEIAHALAGPHHGHDAYWKSICIRVGAKPQRCTDRDQALMPKGAWQATCGGCQYQYHRFRKPKIKKVERAEIIDGALTLVEKCSHYYCPKCGPDRGKLEFKHT